MKKSLIYISLFLAFASCEKIIDMEIPDNGRKIVINSIFNDSSQIEVSLFKSKHILDNANFTVISGASVKALFENGSSETLTEDGSSGVYRSASVVRQAGGYVIKVTATADSASATTSIPNKVSMINIDTTTYVRETEHIFSMEVTFNDPAEKNYYMLGVQRPDDFNPGINNKRKLFLSSMDLSVQTDFDNFLVFNDELFSGKTKTLVIETSGYELGSSTDSIDLTFELRTLSYDAYMFYLTFSKQMNQGSSSFNEPVQVYNNIVNGYGIFGGYSASFRKMKIPAFLDTYPQ